MPPLPPFHLVADALLNAVLPAAGTAAALFFLAVRFGGRRAAPPGAAVGFAVAAALGWWLRDTLTLISGDSPWNRLPWVAFGALGIGLALRWSRIPQVAGVLIRLACSIGIAYAIMPPATRAESLWLSGAFAGLVFAAWVVLEYVAKRSPGGTVPLAYAASFFIAAGVLIHAGSGRLTEAATVAFAASVGVALIALWKRVDAGGMVPAAAVMLPGLLLMGQQETFSEVSWPAFALPTVAPLLLICTLPLRGWSLRILSTILVLLPLIAALALAMETGPLQFE